MNKPKNMIVLDYEALKDDTFRAELSEVEQKEKEVKEDQKAEF